MTVTREDVPVDLRTCHSAATEAVGSTQSVDAAIHSRWSGFNPAVVLHLDEKVARGEDEPECSVVGRGRAAADRESAVCAVDERHSGRDRRSARLRRETLPEASPVDGNRPHVDQRSITIPQRPRPRLLA
jgi:hypothetical protein